MNYSLNQELIINGLIKEKITDLQYQNRLNRQINV